MASMQRRMKRSVDVDPAEVERVRALTVQRLAGVPVTDADQAAQTQPPALTAVEATEADEAIDVAETAEPAPAEGTRPPLVFRIDGLDETPGQRTVDADLEPTPLVMFLGASDSAWPAHLARTASEDLFVETGEDLAVEADGPAPETLFPDDPPAGTPVAVEAAAYCPYCATLLRPAPTADRRCTECKQRIVVRHVGERTVYLAEAALPVFEGERRRIADEERWAATRAHWLGLATASGADAAVVAKAAGEPPTEARVSTARDLYLSSVDRSFEIVARAGQWADAARIRFDEARVLFDLADVPIPALAGDDAS